MSAYYDTLEAAQAAADFLRLHEGYRDVRIDRVGNRWRVTTEE